LNLLPIHPFHSFLQEMNYSVNIMRTLNRSNEMIGNFKLKFNTLDFMAESKISEIYLKDILAISLGVPKTP